MQNRILLLGLALACVPPLYNSANAQDARIWSDKSGKFEVRAKFVDIKDGKVRLERPNGDISRIPLEKLCEEDQEYVRDQEKGVKPSPQKPTGPRVLAVGDRVEAKHFRKWGLGTVLEIDYKWEHAEIRLDGKSNFGRQVDIEDLRWPGTTVRPILVDPVKVAASKLKVIRPDMSDVARPISDAPGQTTVTSDPGPPREEGLKPKPVRLQGRMDFHEHPEDFSIIAGPQPLAMVLHSSPGVGNDGPGRIEMIDLQTKKTIAGGPSLPNTKRLRLSPSGKVVVTITGGHSTDDSTGQIDFWTIDGKQVDHSVSFSPYIMDSWPNAECEWVEWLDDEHLFTANSEGRLILWQFDGAKAIYELMVDRGSKPVLSPGKQQLAVPTSKGTKIFAARTGELLATVGSGNLRNAALAFSPSGKQLAAVSSGFVDVIDITNGEMTRSFPCKGVNGRNGAAWVDEEYLFTSNGLLINVPRRIIAWKFEVGHSLSRSVDGTQWLLVDSRLNKTQILSPLKLPPPKVVQSVKKLSDDKLLAIRPGFDVSIHVKINDRLLAQSVEQALLESCKQAGLKVVDGAKLTLGATMKNGKTNEINYRRFHDHFGKGETLSVTSRVYELQLLLDETPIWKRKSVHSPPHHLQMQKGETIRSAVTRLMKPTAANFRGRLPTYVVRPEFQEPLGTSKISPGM